VALDLESTRTTKIDQSVNRSPKIRKSSVGSNGSAPSALRPHRPLPEFSGLICARSGYSKEMASPHFHDFYEMHWIRAGAGELVLDHGPIAFAAPCVVVIEPGEVHSWKVAENLDRALLCLAENFVVQANFPLSYSQLSSYLQIQKLALFPVSRSESALVDRLFQHLVAMEQDGFATKPELVRSLLFMLFNRIRSIKATRLERSELPKDSPLTLDFKRILRSECPPLVSVKQIVERLGVSRSSLNLNVTRDTGRGPADHIADQIIAHAKSQLLHTEATTEQIAVGLGFASSDRFIDFFLRHSGLGPQMFRIQALAQAGRL